jgi:hypothetical protein
VEGGLLFRVRNWQSGRHRGWVRRLGRRRNARVVGGRSDILGFMLWVNCEVGEVIPVGADDDDAVLFSLGQNLGKLKLGAWIVNKLLELYNCNNKLHGKTPRKNSPIS